MVKVYKTSGTVRYLLMYGIVGRFQSTSYRSPPFFITNSRLIQSTITFSYRFPFLSASLARSRTLLALSPISSSFSTLRCNRVHSTADPFRKIIESRKYRGKKERGEKGEIRICMSPGSGSRQNVTDPEPSCNVVETKLPYLLRLRLATIVWLLLLTPALEPTPAPSNIYFCCIFNLNYDRVWIKVKFNIQNYCV